MPTGFGLVWLLGRIGERQAMLATALAGAVILAALAIAPVAIDLALGSAMVLAIGLSAWILLLTAFSLGRRHHGVPLLWLALLVVGGMLAFDQLPIGRDELRGSMRAKQGTHIEEAYRQWRDEPRRVSRRLRSLRGWSDGEGEIIGSVCA